MKMCEYNPRFVVSNSSLRARGDRKASCQVFHFVRHGNMDRAVVRGLEHGWFAEFPWAT